MAEKVLFVFEIENKQEHYALCTEFIELHEKGTSEKCVLEKWNILKDEGIAMRVSFENAPAPRHIERKVAQLKPLDKNALKNSLELETHYHIRIKSKFKIQPHFLLYLVMMVEKLDYLVGQKTAALKEKQIPGKSRLSIFLLPETSESFFPFGYDEAEVTEEKMHSLNESYRFASKLLRLVAKENTGIIYGLECDLLGSAEVRPLDFKRGFSNFASKACFPIIPIDPCYYDVLYKKTMREFEQEGILPQKIIGRDSAIPNMLNPDVDKALIPFVTDFGVQRLEMLFCVQALQGKQAQIEAFIKEEIYDRNVMTFSLFSILLNREWSAFKEEMKEEELNNILRATLELATDLESALRQIAQNAIQYSTNKSCFLALRLKKVTKKKEHNALEILLADWNDKTEIRESFIKGLETEKEVILGYDDEANVHAFDEIISPKSKMKLRNFFGVFEGNDDTRDKWFNFRQADTSAHIGLTIFRNMMEKCGAKYGVKSSSKYQTGVEERWWAREERRRAHEEREKAKWHMPGTQFYMTIPFEQKEWKTPSNWVQMGNRQNFCANYESYAHFLEYFKQDVQLSEDKISETLEKAGKKSVEIFKEKIELQSGIWKKFWEEQLFGEEAKKKNYFKKKAYFIDFEKHSFISYASEYDNCEVMIKGLINAFGAIDGLNLGKQKIYYAFINVPKSFMQAMQLACVTLALKKFPQQLQLFVSEKPDGSGNFVSQIQLLGKTIGFAVQNAYILSLGQGVGGFAGKDVKQATNILEPFEHNLRGKEKEEPAEKICPFTMLSEEGKEKENKDFFKNFLNVVKEPINEKGYKIENSHTRLGSGVHTDSFYELVFLFYRTEVANRIAFEILRDMIAKDEKLPENERLLESKAKILFYGYASYSQAIIMALTEMLKKYRKVKESAKDTHTSYAIYQYNLQCESSAEEIEVYFSLGKGELAQEEKVNVVQIVPVSTTLKTFGKMFSKLKKDIGISSEKCVTAYNYTVFWVRDQKHEKAYSELEEKYFEKTGYEEAIQNREIEVTPKVNLPSGKLVTYIVAGKTGWSDPLKCEQCWPGERYHERPLIETDDTSTVPAQQITLIESGNNLDSIKDDEERERLEKLYKEESKRLEKLYKCVSYGHFERGKNHFQYYIDTRQYFLNTSLEIKEWLEGKAKEEKKEENHLPVMKIIFSPEHTTNIGFSQYVNMHFFKGTAEVISINEDKKFRSNFICEQYNLIKTIEQVFLDYEQHYGKGNIKKHRPVKFYFADDTIITGESFRKASSLLSVLIPRRYQEDYGTTVFDKCFVLIDRFSQSTRKSYVINPENNFLSFCKINISNMRAAGDSCVGCKLLDDAVLFCKKSATKTHSNYWAKKIVDYSPTKYDKIPKEFEVHDYMRLIISHVLRSCFDLSQKDGAINTIEKEERQYQNILNVLSAIIKLGDSGRVVQIEKSLEGLLEHVFEKLGGKNGNERTRKEASLHMVEVAIKLLSRPFFTYDQTIKTPWTKFIISLTERILSGKDIILESDEEKKASIIRLIDAIVVILEDTQESGGKIKFLTHILFEALGDMGCTYLLREETLGSAGKFIKGIDKADCKVNSCKNRFLQDKCAKNAVECFWKSYAINTQKVLWASKEDTRAIWFEHLLAKKAEYGESVSGLVGTSTLDELGNVPGGKRFLNEILLQNTNVYFNSLEQLYIEKLYLEKFYLKEFCLEKLYEKGALSESWDEFRKNLPPESWEEIQKQLPKSLDEFREKLPKSWEKLQKHLPKNWDELQKQLPKSWKELQEWLPKNWDEPLKQPPESWDEFQKLRTTESGEKTIREELSLFSFLKEETLKEEVSDIEERLTLFLDVLDIEIKDEMKNVALLDPCSESSEKERCYNLEFMKGVIFSIFFDVISHTIPAQGNLLEQIKGLDEEKQNRAYDDEGLDVLLGPASKGIDFRKVIISYEEKEGNSFDYMVIEHYAMDTTQTPQQQTIERKLLNPIDHAGDGHISLLTIKGFVEGERKDLKDKFVFELEPESVGYKKVTIKLPIIAKGASENENK